MVTSLYDVLPYNPAPDVNISDAYRFETESQHALNMLESLTCIINNIVEQKRQLLVYSLLNQSGYCTTAAGYIEFHVNYYESCLRLAPKTCEVHCQILATSIC